MKTRRITDRCLLTLLAAMLAAAPSGLMATPPLNDSFSSPVVLSELPASSSGSNVGATLESSEPLPSFREYAEASVWYRWTPSTTGPVQIDTIGSDFQTVLAVWEGSELTSLTEIVSNEDYYTDELSNESAVFLDVTAGVTYQIAVYGEGASRGGVQLNSSPDITSRIAGKVTGPDGTTPLEGIVFNAYRWNGASWVWLQWTYLHTDANGEYSIRGVPPGTYRVEFQDFVHGDYVGEFYNDAADLESGTDIVVPAETTVTGINASLAATSPPQPPVIVGFQMAGAAQYEIHYTGEVGQTYIILESSSLSGWSLIGQDTCQSGVNVIPVTSTAPRMFWRLMAMP